MHKFQVENPAFFPLSTEQRNAYELILDGKSVSVNACSGSGKSHTMRAAAMNYKGEVHSIPFSRSLSEAETEIYKSFSNITCLNFHRRAIRLCGQCDVKLSKCYDIALKIEAEKANAIADLTEKFKKEGVGIYENALTPEDIAIKYEFKADIIPFALECLEKSDANQKIIDYADMLRFPVINKKQAYLKGLIVLDEVQDYSPDSFVFLRECLVSKETQVAMIGDPERQCLQAFAGANASLFDIMKDYFNCESVEFTENRRCAKAIVSHAPHKGNMKALDDAPEGIVSNASMPDIIGKIENGEYTDSALLSETNAPIVKFGLSLLIKGVSVQMRMQKINMAIYRVMAKYADTRKCPIGNITEKLRNDLNEKIQNGEDVSETKDLIDCIDMLETYCMSKGMTKTTFRFGKPCHPIQQALALMVDSKQGITLMTGHTSKGLEWPIVFYLPAKVKAPTQAWQEQQNNCVAHVIATRAKTEFYTLTTA